MTDTPTPGSEAGRFDAPLQHQPFARFREAKGLEQQPSDWMAQVLHAIRSNNETLLFSLASKMAVILDQQERDAMARRAQWSEKKRRQRMSPNVPETTGDNGGHRGTLGDIGGQTGTSGDNSAPLLPAPSTPINYNYNYNYNYERPSDVVADEPPTPRKKRRNKRSTTRSEAVRETWLSRPSEVWTARMGVFPFGAGAKALKPLIDAGLTSDEIATRLAAYLDDLIGRGETKYVSLPRFAAIHAQYANGGPVDPEIAALLAEARDVSRYVA